MQDLFGDPSTTSADTALGPFSLAPRNLTGGPDFYYWNERILPTGQRDAGPCIRSSDVSGRADVHRKQGEDDVRRSRQPSDASAIEKPPA
jgi:hypothetical protein